MLFLFLKFALFIFLARGTRVMSLIKRWVKTLEFDAHIISRELPIHLGVNLVTARLPCSNLRKQRHFVPLY